jgi:hypothetical protein
LMCLLIFSQDELRELFANVQHPVAYDGFEPSGRMHIAQVRVLHGAAQRRAGSRRTTAALLSHCGRCRVIFVCLRGAF